MMARELRGLFRWETRCSSGPAGTCILSFSRPALSRLFTWLHMPNVALAGPKQRHRLRLRPGAA
jgi:hypothetical protein